MAWLLSLPPAQLLGLLHFQELFFFPFFFFGLATWLVGSQFPNQGLNPGHEAAAVEARNPNH